MTLEVLQHIRQRLATVIDDLKSAIGQEAAKAYLTSVITAESLVLEPEVELCDNSWIEHINEDCMTDASDLSYPIPCSPHKKLANHVSTLPQFLDAPLNLKRLDTDFSGSL